MYLRFLTAYRSRIITFYMFLSLFPSLLMSIWAHKALSPDRRRTRQHENITSLWLFMLSYSGVHESTLTVQCSLTIILRWVILYMQAFLCCAVENVRLWPRWNEPPSCRVWISCQLSSTLLSLVLHLLLSEQTLTLRAQFSLNQEAFKYSVMESRCDWGLKTCREDKGWIPFTFSFLSFHSFKTEMLLWRSN